MNVDWNRYDTLIRNVGLEATVSVCTPRNVVSLSTTTANFNQKEKGQKIT